jgi:GNAT superfamily N-acetyltransferase
MLLFFSPATAGEMGQAAGRTQMGDFAPPTPAPRLPILPGMDFTLRSGRPGDKDAIAAFTQDTFVWGDYVAERFDEWLADSAALVAVAEVAGQPIGLARGTLLSPREGWIQALRVHADHRRRGIGGALVEHLAAWAASHRAQVVRLATDDSNEPARRLIAGLGFHPVGSWLAVERSVTRGGPRGNGGRRRRAAERLSPVPAIEAPAAMLSWTTGPLERASHGLLSAHWSWRRLTLGDLESAAQRGELWHGRPGWAIGRVEGDTFLVPWVSTDPDRAPALARSLGDLSLGAGCEGLQVMIPALDWLRLAFERAGCDLHPLGVYARAL